MPRPVGPPVALHLRPHRVGRRTAEDHANCGRPHRCRIQVDCSNARLREPQTRVTDSSGMTSPVLSSGPSEKPTQLAKRATGSSRTDRRTWLERLPLPAARAQPLPPPPPPTLQPPLARALATGLPMSQVRPIDPLEPGGCCGGPAYLQSYRFQVDFNVTMMSPHLLAIIATASAVQLTANDILTWASAYRLRRNMKCEGITKPDKGCCHAHHIVHRNGYNKDAVRDSQAILATAGIGIDDWENGVYVDCAKHKSTQNGAYDTMVASRLRSISLINRATVSAVLRQIALELGGGC